MQVWTCEMLYYVQQQYFLHAHGSMSVDILAVENLSTFSAAAAAA